MILGKGGGEGHFPAPLTVSSQRREPAGCLGVGPSWNLTAASQDDRVGGGIY
jgi:hypothetical protein